MVSSGMRDGLRLIKKESRRPLLSVDAGAKNEGNKETGTKRNKLRPSWSPVATLRPCVSLDGSQLNSLILLDWDDTLLPSSWLARRKSSSDARKSGQPESVNWVDKDTERLLGDVANNACELIHTAAFFGRVVIVTNAEVGWVELSGNMYLPSVMDALRQCRVTIISARAEYESLTRQHPIQWKIEAFRVLLRSITPSSATCNVVSIGDSEAERTAVLHCVREKQLKNPSAGWLFKSVKLCDQPTPVILLRQLMFVKHILPKVVYNAENLDLRVNLKLVPLDEQKSTGTI